MKSVFHIALISVLWLLVSPLSKALIDANTNGLSDLWEKANNGGELFPGTFDSQADPDGDGWSNEQEAAAGTDPFDANPPTGFLRPEIVHTNAVIGDTDNDGSDDVITPEAVTVSWPTLIGKQYTLYYSTDLYGGSWEVVEYSLIGDGSVIEYHFLTAVSDKFFWRVTIEDNDNDGDDLTNTEEYQLGSNPNIWDTDGDGLGDGDELLGGTKLLNRDSDGDWISDGVELYYGYLPLDASDGMLDTDEDGLPNQLEYIFRDQGYDPIVWNDADSFPWDEDPDHDNLTTREEFDGTTAILSKGVSTLSTSLSFRTHPRKFDSDGDGMPDGWEMENSLNPNDSTLDDGSNGDPDSDGLFNFDEWLNDCNPMALDTDGGGTDDKTEIDQSTDPLEVSDDEDPPPPEQMINVPFTVGDPSESHSEKWKMTIRGLGPDDQRSFSLTSPGFGQPAAKSFNLRRGNSYEISVSHLSTEPTFFEDNNHQSDFDWEATVDAKPSSKSEESFDGIPGVNNYFFVKGHWIVDNRQAVFTTEKHGDFHDIVTGHTALLVPALQRDMDSIDNDWQPIAGDLGQALPGQKINIRFDPSILGYGFSCSEPRWEIQPKIFKDYVADVDHAELTDVESCDLENFAASFYFADSGSKWVKLNFLINGTPVQLTDIINVVEPTSTFTTKIGEVRFQTDVINFNFGLHTNVNSSLGGLGMYGNVLVPPEESEGVWHWVQLGTVLRSKTSPAGTTFDFTMNGQKALDNSYGYSILYDTGGSEKSTSDSPAMFCTGWKVVDAVDHFELYQMFKPFGSESRFVPLKIVYWGWNGRATKSESGYWTLTTSSPPYHSEVQNTSVHPEWDKNLKDGIQPGP